MQNCSNLAKIKHDRVNFGLTLKNYTDNDADAQCKQTLCDQNSRANILIGITIRRT